MNTRIANLLQVNDTTDNKEIIINYLVSDPGTVELSKHQEELLNRWNTVDDLVRSNQYTTNEIARLLCNKFNYGIATAWRDIHDSRYIFSSRPSNKKYLLAIHSERIEQAMQKVLKMGDYKIYALLAKEYTNAVKELPEDSQQFTPAPALVFNLTQNNIAIIAGQPITQEQADAVAKRKLQEKGITDIDYE